VRYYSIIDIAHNCNSGHLNLVTSPPTWRNNVICLYYFPILFRLKRLVMSKGIIYDLIILSQTEPYLTMYHTWLKTWINVSLIMNHIMTIKVCAPFWTFHSPVWKLRGSLSKIVCRAPDDTMRHVCVTHRRGHTTTTSCNMWRTYCNMWGTLWHTSWPLTSPSVTLQLPAASC
jgi:hypothetical protein